ncbi:MAG: FG-GAP repeat protein, partial [Planctomycetaceae bacterium]|nr:FG-GAP repeat protein [Planctomycetaceae bacterium]
MIRFDWLQGLKNKTSRWKSRRVRSARRRKSTPYVEALEDRTLLAGTVVVGADAGGGPHVRVFGADTGEESFNFFPYDPIFSGGVRTALGDISGDGVPDIITAPGPSGGPHIRTFDGQDGTPLDLNFFAYSTDFSGGVYIAAADLTGDNIAEIITGAGAGGGPHVQVFDGATGNAIGGFFAYAPTFTGGVRVAAGDVNGDGTPDIITAPGPGGGPHIQVFDGVTVASGASVFPTDSIRSFFAYGPSFTGGLSVATADLDADGQAEIITGAGAGGGPHVRVFHGSDSSEMFSF